MYLMKVRLLLRPEVPRQPHTAQQMPSVRLLNLPGTRLEVWDEFGTSSGRIQDRTVGYGNGAQRYQLVRPSASPTALTAQCRQSRDTERKDELVGYPRDQTSSC